ncbi:Protoporphyrinogen oxidase [Maioricimonas rarisocia]|uniref:Coproporphyrinogen III oxidase n=1 Tax=Maioricimonas rarisocia TaxID=2528026 RepID=A0A517ZA54_9PLAN|nr:protoporphyrinogen oxidase [Maioricimonas rarisocia]QDU39372.1 Protoporphyrinogen oxidase [Maioricimonas rarisocia]
MSAEIDPPAAQPDRAPLRVAVIGGGISGLAAAHRLLEQSSTAEVTVYEAAERVGGVFGTEQIGEYLIETGADSFITNKPHALDLCRRLGLEDRLIPTDSTYRRSLILHNGEPVPTPDGFNLMVPARIGPMLTTPLLSPLGKLRLGLEYFLPRRTDNGDESLASFVRRRLGQQTFERIVQPMVGGIYTSDPEKLSLAATLPRFLDMERDHGSLIRAALRQRRVGRKASGEESAASGARYGLFASLKGGMSELLEALSRRLEAKNALRLGCPVVAIEPAHEADRTHYEVRLADGTSILSDAVILALPAYRAADLIDGWNRELAETLREIEYASSAIVISGHRLEDIRHPLDAFGLVIPHIEQRQILAVSFLSRKFPGRAPDGRVVLRTFVGGALQPELLEQPDDDLIGMVQGELRDILGVEGKPDFVRVARWHRKMPQYHVGHLERVQQIESLTRRSPGLFVAGNAYHGVGIPDCIRSGEQAAERVHETFVAAGSPARAET